MASGRVGLEWREDKRTLGNTNPPYTCTRTPQQQRTNFKGAKLMGARFYKSALTEADFTGTLLFFYFIVSRLNCLDTQKRIPRKSSLPPSLPPSPFSRCGPVRRILRGRQHG